MKSKPPQRFKPYTASYVVHVLGCDVQVTFDTDEDVRMKEEAEVEGLLVEDLIVQTILNKTAAAFWNTWDERETLILAVIAEMRATLKAGRSLVSPPSQQWPQPQTLRCVRDARAAGRACVAKARAAKGAA